MLRSQPLKAVLQPWHVWCCMPLALVYWPPTACAPAQVRPQLKFFFILLLLLGTITHTCAPSLQGVMQQHQQFYFRMPAHGSSDLVLRSAEAGAC